MPTLQIFQTLSELPSALGIGLFALLGLLIGSFLNVVIYRLPRMMERQWQEEAAAHLADQHAEGGTDVTYDQQPPAQRFNLMHPASRCGTCGHRIRWYENIPILSYVWLKGRCSACKTPISLRYPAVEAVCALLFGLCAWHFGINLTGLAWSGFCAVLLTLTMIDWDTTLLPDDLTLPLLWAGLILAHWQWIQTSLPDALWGAVWGYLSLWSIYWLFKLLTGKEGMGYGDFKLLAALGAWLGWQGLLPVILMASIIGSVVGIAFKLRGKLADNPYIPFGPFLALGGVATAFLQHSPLLGFLQLR